MRPADFEVLRRLEPAAPERRPADFARVEVAVARRAPDFFADFFAPLRDADFREVAEARTLPLLLERFFAELEPRPLPDLAAPVREISLLKLLFCPFAVVS